MHCNCYFTDTPAVHTSPLLSVCDGISYIQKRKNKPGVSAATEHSMAVCDTVCDTQYDMRMSHIFNENAFSSVFGWFATMMLLIRTGEVGVFRLAILK